MVRITKAISRIRNTEKILWTNLYSLLHLTSLNFPEFCFRSFNLDSDGSETMTLILLVRILSRCFDEIALNYTQFFSTCKQGEI